MRAKNLHYPCKHKYMRIGITGINTKATVLLYWCRSSWRLNASLVAPLLFKKVRAFICFFDQERALVRALGDHSRKYGNYATLTAHIIKKTNKQQQQNSVCIFFSDQDTMVQEQESLKFSTLILTLKQC